MPGTTRVCSYCGGDGLTKEHVWPKWLSNSLKTSGDDWGHVIRGDAAVLREWRSSPFTMTVKYVCRNCNSGWMSKLLAAGFFDHRSAAVDEDDLAV